MAARPRLLGFEVKRVKGIVSGYGRAKVARQAECDEMQEGRIREQGRSGGARRATGYGLRATANLDLDLERWPLQSRE